MKVATILFCVAFCAVSAISAPSNSFSYQGRLTDPGGNPVPDGSYNVTFAIWTHLTLGVVVWNSGAVPVTTSDGLFSVELGAPPQTSLPLNLFNDSSRYLAISINGDPDLSPRTRIVASPYSFYTRTVDAASGGRISGDVQFNNGTTDYFQTKQSSNAVSTYTAGGVEATRIWGPTYGEFIAYDSVSGLPRAQMGAGGNNYPYLNLAANGQNIILLAADTADNTVRFPDGAINSRELLNEPGIASGSNTDNIIVPPGGAFSDIQTVTITTPAAGYIEVEGRGYASLFGVVGRNLGTAQIDESPGGGLIANQFTSYGFDSMPNASTVAFPVYVKATYFKSAGTYTFRIEAAQHPVNTPPASQFFSYAVITARYIPTSYGPVAGVVARGNDHEFDHAISIGSSTRDGIPLESGSIVDLRSLELRLAKEEAAVERTRRIILQEKLTQNAKQREMEK